MCNMSKYFFVDVEEKSEVIAFWDEWDKVNRVCLCLIIIATESTGV